MKKINLIIVGLALLVFTACEKETTGDKSSITNYPIITVDGANPMFVELGTTFTDPGAVAKAGETEVPITTSSSGAYQGGEMDNNVPDCYDITYTATNSDGFDGTSHRTVYVAKTGDLTSSIEGLYTATIVRNGSLRFSDLGYTLIWKNTDGTYSMSCGIGSYYENGVGYGETFNAPASITANDISANDFSVDPFSVLYGGWPWAINMSGITVDAGAKKINYTSVWDAGFTFEVELTQVAL